MRSPLTSRLVMITILAILLAGAPAPAAVTHGWPAEGDAGDAVGTADGVLAGGVSFGEGSVGQGFVTDHC